MHCIYPSEDELTGEEIAAHVAVQEELERLSAEWEDESVDLPRNMDERLVELEAEIERTGSELYAYDPDVIARGGVFVVLNYDGSPADFRT